MAAFARYALPAPPPRLSRNLSCTAHQVSSSMIRSCAPSTVSLPARTLPTYSGFVSRECSEFLLNVRPLTTSPALLVQDFVVQARPLSSATTPSSDPTSRYKSKIDLIRSASPSLMASFLSTTS